MNRCYYLKVQLLLVNILCLLVQENYASFGDCKILRRERYPINMFAEDNKQYFIINDGILVQKVLSIVCLPDQLCAGKGTCKQVYRTVPLLAIPADDQDSNYKLVNFKFPDGCKCMNLF